MAKKTTPNPEASEQQEATAPEPAAEESAPETAEEVAEEATVAEQAAADAGVGDDDPAARVAELELEVTALKDKLLRALAETENIRRRSVREREDASKYAIAGFARELLAVADNLRRALDAVDDAARGDDPVLQSLCTGVEMTEKAMLDSFDRVGIKRIEAMGQRFDHNLHEALFEMEDPGQPSGTVVQVIETGYTLHDRLLRPSKVGVSRGGPKEAPAAEGGDEAEGGAKGGATAYEKKGGTGAQVDQET